MAKKEEKKQHYKKQCKKQNWSMTEDALHCSIAHMALIRAAQDEENNVHTKEAAGLRCTKAQGGMLLLAKTVKTWLSLSWLDFTQSGLAELGALGDRLLCQPWQRCMSLIDASPARPEELLASFVKPLV